MKQPDTLDRLCDCRVWRKAMAPLQAAAMQVQLKARASAPIDGVKMKRVPAALIDDLSEAVWVASQMFPADPGKDE